MLGLFTKPTPRLGKEPFAIVINKVLILFLTDFIESLLHKFILDKNCQNEI